MLSNFDVLGGCIWFDIRQRFYQFWFDVLGCLCEFWVWSFGGCYVGLFVSLGLFCLLFVWFCVYVFALLFVDLVYCGWFMVRFAGGVSDLGWFCDFG